MLDRSDLDPERIRPLRRVEYEQLVEAGAFEDEHVELLFGQLVAMSPQGPVHSAVASRIMMMLVRQIPPGLDVRAHSGLAASDDSMPEPDVSLVPGGLVRAHPSSALLVVEVADSSFRKDSTVKAVLYARAGIPRYWLVDLQRGVVLVHSCPVDGRYTLVERRVPGDLLTIDDLPGVSIPVGEIVPPAS